MVVSCRRRGLCVPSVLVWRVAVIDSGLACDTQLPVVAQRRFKDRAATVSSEAGTPDVSGHGTAVAQVIHSQIARAGLAVRWELLIGQVIGPERRTTAATVAAAIEWAIGERANLIHISLGLRDDRRVLADAVAGAIRGGCLLVGSTPARGEVSYPARYPGVVRATGDARCEEDELAFLHSAQADFGACPRHAGVAAAGASIGAAHVTGIIVARCSPGLDVASVRQQLAGLAKYRGAERRTA